MGRTARVDPLPERTGGATLGLVREDEDEPVGVDPEVSMTEQPPRQDSGGDASAAVAEPHVALRVAVTTVALVLAGVHLLWPDVRIDAITLGLLVAAALPWLAPIIKQVSYGGATVEFREFKRRVETELVEVRTATVDTKQQFSELETRVHKVEDFVFSGEVTPQEQERLTRTLSDFRRYLESIGAPRAGEMPEVHIGPLEAERGGQFYRDEAAYYDRARNLIVVGRRISEDPDPVLRQYAHYVLMPKEVSFSHDVTTQGRTVWRSPLAIESGLATYLPCSFRDDPCFGRVVGGISSASGPARDCWIHLVNDLTTAAMTSNSTVHEGADLWAGALWELRGALGRPVLDPVVTQAWLELRSAGADRVRPAARFVDVLLQGLDARGAGDRARDVLVRRGLMSRPRSGAGLSPR